MPKVSIVTNFKPMKYLLTLFSIAILFFSCSKEESEKKTGAEIIDIKLLNSNLNNLLIEQVVIDVNNVIYLLPNMPIPNDVSILSLTVDIEISEGASIAPKINVLEFESSNDEYSFIVTAENGKSSTWLVRFVGNQLQNSQFEFWYETNGMDGQAYTELGKDANTIWGTANYGTSTYGVYGTTKETDSVSTHVKLNTGFTDGVPLTAATIFTGNFNSQMAILNPTDPRKATDMGTPFSLRPVSFQLNYKYSPGAEMIAATPNNPSTIFGGFTIEQLNSIDQCHIYVILERRIQDVIIEVGSAEFYTSESNETLKQIVVPFDYFNDNSPTHISFVATSSKAGDLFTGAIGSTLIIDDLSFNYE